MSCLTVLDHDCISLSVQKNHLSGLQRKLLRLTFWNSQTLMDVRREVAPIIARNKHKNASTEAYNLMHEQRQGKAAQRVQVLMNRRALSAARAAKMFGEHAIVQAAC